MKRGIDRPRWFFYILMAVGILVGSGVSGGQKVFAAYNSITDLGTFGSHDSLAFNITNSGTVVGYTPRGAYIWDKISGMKKLGTFGGDWSAADDINNLGTVVGLSRIDPNDPQPAHAFVWEKGIMIGLGTLGGNYSAASGINDFDEIVGISLDSYDVPRPVLWEDGQITDLYSLIVGNPVFDFLYPSAQQNPSRRQIPSRRQTLSLRQIPSRCSS